MFCRFLFDSGISLLSFSGLAFRLGSLSFSWQQRGTRSEIIRRLITPLAAFPLKGLTILIPALDNMVWEGYEYEMCWATIRVAYGPVLACVPLLPLHITPQTDKWCGNWVVHGWCFQSHIHVRPTVDWDICEKYPATCDAADRRRGVRWPELDLYLWCYGKHTFHIDMCL